MKNLKIALTVITVAFTIISCTSNQEPSKKTGQDAGVNTIDSTPAQTSDTVAPGYPRESADSGAGINKPTPGSMETEEGGGKEGN